MKGKIAHIVVKKRGCKTTKLPYTVQVRSGARSR